MNEQKIEGVPDGWRLVRIGRPKDGEWFMDSSTGDPCIASCDWYGSVHVIIEKIITYRDVNPGDIGNIIEINIDNYWYERKLLAVLPEKFNPRYIYETAGGNAWGNAYEARIKIKN